MVLINAKLKCKECRYPLLTSCGVVAVDVGLPFG